jgi:hypothetical protein
MEGIDRELAARYLQYLIAERAEVRPYFHDRLAGLYLAMVLAGKKGDPGGRPYLNVVVSTLSIAQRGKRRTENC